MPLVDDRYFSLAIDNISGLGDTDVFPLRIENHVLRDSRDAVVELLHDISADFDTHLNERPPINCHALYPAGYNGFRWTTQIDPLWNVYLLGIVLSLAASIEEVRLPKSDQSIYSYRYDPDGDHLFERDGWQRFRERSTELAKQCKFVVVADIADFYGRVYHHRLDNELRYVDGVTERPRQILKLLGNLSHGASYGLPVGGPAARILAELLLAPTDQLLRNDARLEFTRYADDYRFFVDDMEEAYRAIGFLSEKLQRIEGLGLQRSKTRIMTSAEFLSTVTGPEPVRGSAAKFLNLHLYFDPYSDTAIEDYETLKNSLDEFDVLGLLRFELDKERIDTTLTKKLVGTLEHMDGLTKVQAIKSLLENLTTLTPIVPHVMRAIRKNVDSLEVDDQIFVHSEIRRLIVEGHHLTRIDMNLSYMIRVLAQRRLRENEQLLSQLYQRSHGYTGEIAPNIQADILLIFAKWKATYWLTEKKSHYPTLHPWVKRAFIIGSYALGEAGGHWRQSQARSFSRFDLITRDWISQRFNRSDWELPI